LTVRAAWRYLDDVRRLELGAIRICGRCGRGRAELCTEDGGSLVVRLGAHRARRLAPPGTGAVEDVPWLGDVVLGHAADLGLRIADVVLDDGPQGLRGLVTWTQAGGDVTVAACEPEEALEMALRAGVPIFATDEALHPDRAPERPGHTLH
jgi:hypothetical protein